MASRNKTKKLTSKKPSAVASTGKPWATISAVVAIVALAGVVFGYVTLRNDQAGDEATAKANDVIAQSERPFGQHYRGLGKA